MADDTGGGDRDQQLRQELRRVLAGVDPIPPEATAYAKVALGWRRIDADLAELLGDSMLASGALAGTRSASAGARTVTFRADALELDLEISVDEESGLVLLGQLAPAIVTRIEVQRDDGSVAAETKTDELGRFRVVLAAGGAFVSGLSRQGTGWAESSRRAGSPSSAGCVMQHGQREDDRMKRSALPLVRGR